MNNMNFSNLEFCKVHITNHGGKDYYLYYQNLIKCIKNILSVPDITQDFALSCENYEVNIVNLNNLIIFILIDLYLIYSVMEKEYLQRTKYWNMVKDYARIFTSWCQIIINYFIFGCHNHGYIRKKSIASNIYIIR